MSTLRPFLKWAGGKRDLAESILKYAPGSFGTYYEPFVGGGAILGRLAPRVATIGDVMPHLAQCYMAVRYDVGAVVEKLSVLRYNRDTFYAVRHRFNSESHAPPSTRAAWFIYLNRTCFNGLTRFNRSGEFNTPFGKYKDPTICDEELLRRWSLALSRVLILNGDFEATVAGACAGDLVYMDPPYVPSSATANFTGYTAGGFGDTDQVRLASVFRKLVTRGCHVLLSNSDTPRSRELYRNFRIVELQRSGRISCKPNGRDAVGEILVIGT